MCVRFCALDCNLIATSLVEEAVVAAVVAASIWPVDACVGARKSALAILGPA